MLEQRLLGGRYRLEEELGSGGMAVVWRARDEVLGRAVAVKVLAGDTAGQSRSRRRIREEARIAAALSHPNIAQVHDFGETDDDGRPTPYVVMELVPGATLQQRLAEGPMPPDEVFRVCAEVAAALTAAHAAGLVHRDIKPANVILTPRGAKVVDFGIAASIGRGGAGELPDEVLGTPSYLAPERLTDDAVEPASDVYALGVLLYKLLAGRLPWAADTPTQILTAHVYTEPYPLPELPGVPAAVADLCLRCLRKDPARRPDATEVAAVLTAAAAGTASPASTASTASTASPAGPAAGDAPAAAAWPRSSLLLAGAIFAVAVVVLAWSLTRNRSAPASPPAGGAQSAPAVPGAAGNPAPAAGTATPGPSSRRTGTATTGPPPPGAQPAPSGAAPPESASDSPPDTGPGTTPGTTPADSPPRTLSSAAGSVRAECTGAGLSHLVSWTPVKPYRTGEVEAGPAPQTAAVFRRGNAWVRMTVTCSGGVPSAVTTTS